MKPRHNTPDRTMIKQSVLIYGHPGVGKTTFCSEIPDALFLATEKGYRSLEIDVIDIDSWATFCESVEYIREGKHPYKAVVIDTVDNLLYLAGDLAVKSYNRRKHKAHKYMNEVPFQEAHAIAREMIRPQLDTLSKLPYGLFLISHAIPMTDSTGMIKYVPSLDKGIAAFTSFFVDIVLFVKTDKTRYESEAYTKPDPGYDAKDRTGLLPGKFDFRYPLFADAFKNQIDYKSKFKTLWKTDKEGTTKLHKEMLQKVGRDYLLQDEYRQLIENYQKQKPNGGKQ